jgi:hypothetical protein
MSNGLVQVLELLKIILPLVLLYFIIRIIVKRQYSGLMAILNSKAGNERSKLQMKAKMQALERMALYLERIDLKHLVYRLNEPGLNSRKLYYSMLITLQQELEHNITQQLYVSDKLWQIIQTAKDHQVQILDQIKTEIPDDAPAKEFIEKLHWYVQQANDPVLDTARRAVKQEAKLLL